MKYICITLCIATLFFVSCKELIFGPEKIYPQNITIPGYGKLVYSKTLFDGKDIKDTMVKDGIIWSLDYFTGKVYKYNSSTKRTTTLDIEKQNTKTNTSIYSLCLYMFVNNYMAINNDNIIIPFVINKEDKKNYIVKIEPNNASFSYEKMPDMFDNTSFWDGFFFNDKLYFRMWERDDNIDSDVMPYATTDFKNYTMITEEEFWSVAESCPEYYYSDSKNRLYDTEDHSSSHTETYLRVSIDNGNTWYKGNMGTNYANRVISVDDTVYVSCHTYYEVIGPFPIASTGGGLHIFQWEYVNEKK